MWLSYLTLTRFLSFLPSQCVGGGDEPSGDQEVVQEGEKEADVWNETQEQEDQVGSYEEGRRAYRQELLLVSYHQGHLT